MTPSPKAITVDFDRLGQFVLRLFAGIFMVALWTTLISVVFGILIFGILMLAKTSWFIIGFSVVLTPVLLFLWWACFFLSLDFLTDIGISFDSRSKYLILPIAIPITFLSFAADAFTALASVLKHKIALFVAFGCGLTMVVATLFAIL